MGHFNIGDTVITPYGYGAGVVVDISSYSIGVRHLKHNDHMHNCSRLCEMGYGWYYSPSNLKILRRVTPKTKQERVIEKIKYLDEKFKNRKSVNTAIDNELSFLDEEEELYGEDDEPVPIESW